MAYSELIKNFEKIRDYMREFYVYGFKSREEFKRKSARSYDDERRRIESWLGDYMSFRHTPEGKNVFISVDNRNVPLNPLYNAWKTKSFTDRDIVLHFCILDVLADGNALTVNEITDLVTENLSHSETPFEFDDATIRNKLKEYSGLGLIHAEKRGKTNYYRLAKDSVDQQSWADAVSFFSEESPLGVIGSYLLDRQDEPQEYFSYKHHYLLHALDSQVLYDILVAMKENRNIEIKTFSSRTEKERIHKVYPLRFYISTQTEREYLLVYHYRLLKPMFFRMDMIRSIKPGEVEPEHQKYEGFAGKLDENLWGVSLGSELSLDHVEMTVHVNSGERYIIDRLYRERRHGHVEELDNHTYKFSADIYDAGELIPWARSFIGRVVRFESSNPYVVERFYADNRRMAELYGGGETP